MLESCVFGVIAAAGCGSNRDDGAPGARGDAVEVRAVARATPSGARAYCGDGVLRTEVSDPSHPFYEECDDGARNSDTAPNACRTNCRLPSCGDGVLDDPESCDLAVASPNASPTRLASGPGGELYVTDAMAGSVFFYDAELNVLAELKGLDRPLGVAVGPSDAMIYVGVDGRDHVAVYSPSGERVRVIDDGGIAMPSDLEFDSAGDLYVVDSRSDAVHVYDPEGRWLRDLGGTAVLGFPSALAIADVGEGEEIFVADQIAGDVKVFGPDGAVHRTLGERAGLERDWQGRFVRITSLAVDGRHVHVADSYQDRVQILDAVSGAFLGAYGNPGKGMGELRLALDIHIDGEGRVYAANTGNRRVEELRPEG